MPPTRGISCLSLVLYGIRICISTFQPLTDYRRLHRTGPVTGLDLSRALSEPQYGNYKIVVTGHSLGAGTATILAFLLREKYPERGVTCYAFSPPGGLLRSEIFL